MVLVRGLCFFTKVVFFYGCQRCFQWTRMNLSVGSLFSPQKVICPYTHIENLVLAHTDTHTHIYKHKHTRQQFYPQPQAQFSASH